jgi:hypothetical protein
MQAVFARLAVLVVLCSALPAAAQQVPDTLYDTRVARPAFAGRPLRVLFDEAHHNFHTTTGRYLVFARLVRGDGGGVTPNAAPFTTATLAPYQLLVIANALGSQDMSDSSARRAAFTPEECAAVHDWVVAGGALLLIADHAPMGDAARVLAEPFGVDMRGAYTVDPEQGSKQNPSLIAFTPGHGLGVTHPIIAGRDSGETVRRVLAFTGQSLAGPPGAVSLLTLSDKAEDLLTGYHPGDLKHVPASQRRPAGGRSMGLAFRAGQGRVVVLGEAAMMSAQRAGSAGAPMGMNAPGSDDRQFALNVVRWLGGALP